LELSAVPSSYYSGQLDPDKVLHGWKSSLGASRTGNALPLFGNFLVG
jgi:hypothetical protein